MTQRILVVEDDIHGQQITRSVLEHYGYRVDTADTAEQALRLLGTNGYNGAIIDLSLPDVSGWELLADILATYSPQTLPCIAITAYHSPQVAQQVLDAGFVAYFPKPMDIEEFAAQINQYLVD